MIALIEKLFTLIFVQILSFAVQVKDICWQRKKSALATMISDSPHIWYMLYVLSSCNLQ